MSAEMGECSACGQTKRLSVKGLVYTHPRPGVGGECEGSRKPVKPLVLEALTNPEYTTKQVLEAVEEFRASVRRPVKRTLRQRLRDRFRRVSDTMDDAQDVFDDE